jgi:H+/Cl- antiporter ClcA
MAIRWRHTLARLAGGVDEQARLTVQLLRWVVLGIGVGLISGVASAALLVSLNWATDTRVDHGWLLWFLPLAGLAMGCLYHYTGGRAAEGNNLIIDEIHEPDAGVPRRMAPLIFVSTVVTQLFGGSAGREGTGIQLSVSLNDAVARHLPITRDQRRILMIAAMSAGFGAVFGVPLAGAVFGLEVQSIGRFRYEALVPSLTGALVGDLVVRGLGVHHPPTPELTSVDLNVSGFLKVAALGIVFGIVGAVFVLATNAIKRIGARIASWPPARPFIGGVLIIGLTLLVGTRQYLGLSIPLATSALDGNETSGSVFALKLLFTVVTLGFGFYGGEVTPLLVIGATLGAALAPVLGLPIALGAAVGYVAVFAGAANVPLACTIMAVELFGGQALAPAAVACVIAYAFSSHRSIYRSQRVAVSKGGLRGFLGRPLRDIGPDDAAPEGTGRS